MLSVTGKWMLSTACLVVGIAMLVGAVAMCTAGCSQANSPSVDARALARGTVETLETAWLDAANACVATGDPATAKKCEAFLDPARNALVVAADAVNSWTAADQSNFPCLLAQVIRGLSDTSTLLSGLKVLSDQLSNEIQDGLNLASAFLPQCVAADGGNG